MTPEPIRFFETNIVHLWNDDASRWRTICGIEVDHQEYVRLLAPTVTTCIRCMGMLR